MAVDRRRAQIEELKGKIRANQAIIKGISDAHDTAGTYESPEEMSRIKSLNVESSGWEQQVQDLNEVIKSLGSFDNKDPQNPAGGHAGGGKPGEHSMQDAMKSVGQQFIEYKPTWDHIKSLGSSNIGGVQFVTPKMAVKSFGPRNAPSQEMQDYLRTLVTGGSDWANDGTSGGALVIPQFSPIVDSFYQRPLMIRDLVTNGQTDADVIFWVQVNSTTNNAAPTAEAANAAFGNGYNGSGQKPESAMDWVPKSSTVKTIAHWIPITQKALQNGRQIQTYINEFMRYGLDEELEDQIVSGDGNGENFEGIMETPGIIETDFMVDLFKSARRARTEVKIQGRTNASAYVLHPYDVETLDTARESNTLGAFYGANPIQNGGYSKRTLWGLPVVESEAIPEGKGICANWRMAMLWDRMQSTISISNSHLDFFTRNLLAILGEASHAFAVIRPKAFCVFDTQEAS